jgi:mannose-6-phosphate isomerase-like protein (cupin superfamily)
MHDITGSHWHEPKAGENAGFGQFKRKAMPYDTFMESEGVPVYRGIGVKRVQDLPMQPWKRLGGRGSYIQLFGTEGLWGQYVVEVPGAGALNVERHLYEKICLVVEGRGSTEVWQEGQTKKHVFEWQKGSLFAIPLNAFHRIVNASSSPALILCGTSAPNVMNLIDNPNFIFDCPHNFSERFSGADDYFKPNDDVEPDPIRGLAMRRTNFIPDIVGTELPLDNRRSPGYRRVEPSMAGNRFYVWIGEHETGRYSKAHKHASAAVAGGAWHAALEERQGRQGAVPGIRAGRAGLGRADGGRLVPPAFRHQQGRAAHQCVARPQQSARAQARRAGRAARRLRRDRLG